MKCLPPTVMNNYFISFCLLTHLGVNNIWATGVFIKNRLSKCTNVGDKQPQKRYVTTLNRARKAKKVVQLWQWLVWTTSERCTLLLLNFLNLEGLFGVWTKLNESIFKNNNQTNSTLTNRTRVFSTGWTRTFSRTRLVSEWKNGVGPRLFKWSMLFFKMREFCIILTKMKAMSLCLSYFAIFLKYSKESRSSSSYVGIQNVPSDICYEVAHY